MKFDLCGSHLSQQPQRWKLGLLAFALLLRIAWILAVPISPVSDGHVYDLLARSLAQGIGYCWSSGQPTAYWPVGTSFVYSLLYRLFGFVYWPIALLNLALALASIGLLVRLAERWFGPRVALIAGVLFALWPLQIEFTTVLASELLFNLLLLAILALWEENHLNPWLRAALIGLASAAACYVRPLALLLPLLLLLMTVAREHKLLRPILHTALALLVLAAALTPWSLRNTRIFGRFELISTNGGPNFWMGNHPGGTGDTEPLPTAAENLPEGQRDTYLASQARAYIRAYPIAFLERTVHKALSMHDRETIGVHWNAASIHAHYGARAFWALKLCSDLYWWFVLALALFGSALSIRSLGLWRFLLAPPALVWIYFTAIYAITVTQDRYHFPCLPSIALLAAVALDAAWTCLPNRAAD